MHSHSIVADNKNYHQRFDIVDLNIGHLHSNYPVVNENDFVVECSFRLRHYQTLMRTHDAASMSLVVNTDASVGCQFVVEVDFLFQRHFELVLVLVVYHHVD